MMSNNSHKRLLVVEDEEDINEMIVHHLKGEGYKVTPAFSGSEAISKFEEGEFDLVVLDILLPGSMDGWQVCQHIRSASGSSVPLVFLTALSDEPDRVKGFDLGCDDYIVKPFSPRELVSRISAILRRARSDSREVTSVHFGRISIDFLNHQVQVDGQSVHLTNTEFRLLQLLVTNEGRVYSREELLTLMREEDFDLELGNVDVHVHHLRQKLEERPKKPKYLQTVWGVGYRFNGDDSE